MSVRDVQSAPEPITVLPQATHKRFSSVPPHNLVQSETSVWCTTGWSGRGLGGCYRGNSRWEAHRSIGAVGAVKNDGVTWKDVYLAKCREGKRSLRRGEMGKRRKREGKEGEREKRSERRKGGKEGGGREEKNEDYQVYGDCFFLKFTYLPTSTSIE